MRQAAVQRKIQDLQARVTSLRTEVNVLNEQIEVIDEEVEDLRVRAVVSETPLAAKEHAAAARHAALAHRAKHEAVENISRLEVERDELLKQLSLEVTP